MARHFRKHWKKYVFGSLAFTFGGSYFTRKFRDKNVIREYCNKAKQYGETQISSLERPKKITVFLNPMAKKMDAKIQFMKYAGPLFHLSGYDVTIVESEYTGQIRTLMGYIDPDCDAIVVAGGDGTIMEVVNGLLRRWDVEKTRAIPVGVLPLGKENRFYSRLFSSRLSLSQTRQICEATMDIIRGNTVPINMMQLEPESGKTLYALSSIHWGVFRDSLEIKDRFKLFGKFRLLISHIRTALRGWPSDYSLRLWFPASSKSIYIPSTASLENPQTNSTKTETEVLNQNTLAFRKKVKATSLVGRADGWQEKQLDLVGLHLQLIDTSELEKRLNTVIWPAGLSKWDFVKQGWSASLGRSVSPLPGSVDVESSQLILQPHSRDVSWLNIDGEAYEAMPLAVSVLPSVIRVFTKQS